MGNQVYLSGCAVSNFTYSREIYGEKFYQIMISVERNSGNTDTLPVVVSERLIDVSQDYLNEQIYIEGQFRSFNMFDGNKKKLILYIFASEIYVTDEVVSINKIIVDGYICTAPIHRSTPLGRQITDFIVASNRQYGKSDYLPCICWGRTAVFASSFPVGQHIELTGRIQSREYIKNGNRLIAYEISIIELNNL